MRQPLRRYLIRILAVQGAFLLAVIAVVALAGVMLYRSAQREAEAAAVERLRRPAERAAEAIRRHADDLVSTLSLDLAAEGAALERAVPAALWEQISGRASDLLVVDGGGGGEPTLTRRLGHAGGGVSPALVSGLDAPGRAEDLVARQADFLNEVLADGRPAVSGPVRIGPPGEGRALLAAVPREDRLLVATVPIDHLERQYVAGRVEPGQTAILLLDVEERFVGGAPPLQGTTLTDEAQAGRLPGELADYIAVRIQGRSEPSASIDGPVRVGSAEFDGVLAVVVPVALGRRDDAGAGADTAATAEDASAVVEAPPRAATADPRSRRMFLAAMTDRGAVLQQLEEVSRTATLWAAGLIVAVTAVIASSGVALVRGRTRLERLRTEVVDRELREARSIQERWLPDADPGRKVGHRVIDLAATNVPASHISGDFYNYFDLPGGRCALVVGDVTGHGSAAAFLMATSQLLVRTTLERTRDPGRTLTEVNDLLARAATGGQFVTLILAVVDADADAMDVASAGHAGPLACDEIGRWRELEVEGELVLGVTSGIEYPTHTLPLDGATALMFYTDGAVEAVDPDGRRFDLRQLSEGMRAEMPGGPASAKEVVDAALSVVRGFAGGTEFDDDVTLLAAHLTPKADSDPKAAAPPAAVAAGA